MRRTKTCFLAVLLAVPMSSLLAQDNPMTFFVTSVGLGKGADLGGLAGADRHCQSLAEGVGAGDRTWRAYLSTQGAGAVNARDRIGNGPWHNANGNRVAPSLEELHSFGHRISGYVAVAENGGRIPGSGFVPNRHDILTGTKQDGTAYGNEEDMSCQNWTSSGEGKARLGHHDYAAWNSAHDSRGCSQEALRASGGDGLFYCFAID